MPQDPKDNQLKARPNTIPWPPIVLLGAVLSGWLLNRYVPTVMGFSMTDHFPLAKVQTWLGWLLIALAITMDVWVLKIFNKHNTNIRPDRPAERLVSTGPFAFSRNPIYVGNVAIILGLSIANGSLWYLVLAVVVFALIQELAIKREEAHLTARFGDDWLRYESSVRRWL